MFVTSWETPLIVANLGILWIAAHVISCFFFAINMWHHCYGYPRDIMVAFTIYVVSWQYSILGVPSKRCIRYRIVFRVSVYSMATDISLADKNESLALLFKILTKIWLRSTKQTAEEPELEERIAGEWPLDCSACSCSASPRLLQPLFSNRSRSEPRTNHFLPNFRIQGMACLYNDSSCGRQAVLQTVKAKGLVSLRDWITGFPSQMKHRAIRNE